MKKLFVSLLPVILFFGMWTKAATAQNSETSQPSAGFVGWDASKPKSSDVVVTAIIQQVVPNRGSGIPTGLHLMLGTPQGVLDASVGPYLPQDVQEMLAEGQQIRVMGQIKTIRDQKYLLVREFSFNGRVITVRNDHGSLVRSRTTPRTRTTSLQNTLNGELQ